MSLYYFNDKPDIEFKYLKKLPPQTINLRNKRKSAYKINRNILFWYAFYRNVFFKSYNEKADLANDIKKFPKVYREEKESKLEASPLYNNSLYHYSVNIAIKAMREWQDPSEKMQCYIAYKDIKGCKTKIGFIYFQEREVLNKKVIYIAHIGTSHPGQGIGSHLMECVLGQYPEGTEFYVLTRIFNTEAKNLYKDRFKFTPIDESEVRQFGLDDRYCGFKHTTTFHEIQTIKNKIISVPIAKPLEISNEPVSVSHRL